MTYTAIHHRHPRHNPKFNGSIQLLRAEPRAIDVLRAERAANRIAKGIKPKKHGALK